MMSNIGTNLGRQLFKLVSAVWADNLYPERALVLHYRARL